VRQGALSTGWLLCAHLAKLGVRLVQVGAKVARPQQASLFFRSLCRDDTSLKNNLLLSVIAVVVVVVVVVVLDYTLVGSRY